MRDTNLQVRMSDEELERIRQLAAHYGITVAALIRMLVKRDMDAVKR